jgi:hypothetical protein
MPDLTELEKELLRGRAELVAALDAANARVAALRLQLDAALAYSTRRRERETMRAPRG